MKAVEKYLLSLGIRPSMRNRRGRNAWKMLVRKTSKKWAELDEISARLFAFN